jgi:hypothetical protein
MRKIVPALALTGALVGLAAPAASAAPPGLPDDNPNPQSAVISTICPEVSPEYFDVWYPASRAFESQVEHNGGRQVGHPIGVDLPVGVRGTLGTTPPPGKGTESRTTQCYVVNPLLNPDPPYLVPVLVMVTGSPS